MTPIGPLVVCTSGATAFPSSVTNTLTAAEFADVSCACDTCVLLNKPVTSEGVISKLVPWPFGVLIYVSSIIVGVLVPGMRAPPFCPGVVLIVHCVVVILAVKFPLLCAETIGAARMAKAAIAPGRISLQCCCMFVLL